jgi:hypothetical protein
MTQMSQYNSPYAPDDTGQAQQSNTDVAREETAGVGRAARDAGSQVASTATDQARQVADETRRQARDLMGEAAGHAREQASVQQQKTAEKLRSVAGELHEMAQKSSEPGMAADLAHQAADRISAAASWLERREPGDLLEEIRAFARQRPGVFLAGAAVAGLATGRLTRGLAASSETGNGAAQPPQSSVGAPPFPAGADLADPGSTGPAGYQDPVQGTVPASPPYPGSTAPAGPSPAVPDPAVPDPAFADTAIPDPAVPYPADVGSGPVYAPGAEPGPAGALPGSALPDSGYPGEELDQDRRGQS